MTRGLLAGAFWGLVTGALVLSVAALVLDHRAAQPLEVPAVLAEIIGTRPEMSVDAPAASPQPVARQSDPALDVALRQAKKPAPADAIAAPPGAEAPQVGLLAFSAWSRPDFAPPRRLLSLDQMPVPGGNIAPRPAAFPLSQQNGVPALVAQLDAVPPATLPVGTGAPVVALPQAPAEVGQIALVNAAPKTLAPLRLQTPGGFVAPQIQPTPEPIIDAQLNAPDPTPAPVREALPPVEDQSIPPNATQISQPDRSPALDQVPPAAPGRGPHLAHVVYPPQLQTAPAGTADVVLILATSGPNTPVPEWAGAVLWDQTGFGAAPQTTHPLVVRSAAAQAQDGANWAILPSRNGEGDYLLASADAVAGTDGAQPVYRWLIPGADTLAASLKAAEARARRDGRVYLIVGDDRATDQAVQAWLAGLDPSRTRTAPLPLGGS